MTRVTTGYHDDGSQHKGINDLDDPKGADKGPGSATNHEKNHVQNLTEFDHWAAEVSEHIRLHGSETYQAYTEWLEARSARLRRLDEIFEALRKRGCTGIVIDDSEVGA